MTTLALAGSAVVITAGTQSRVASASTFDIVGPDGSEDFGGHLHVLSNGNFVVVDAFFGLPGKTDVGAVYLYDGSTNQLISTLHGSRKDDVIGSDGIVEVGDGNFVVRSPSWSNGALPRTGAATWVDGVKGLNGEVSAANSLVGSTTNEFDSGRTIVLTNRNYVLVTPYWSTGTTTRAGAVTWGNGGTGVAGVISAANSLVGSKADDFVGTQVEPLTNGNYVVGSFAWDNVGVENAGAATWANGATGIAGPVTAGNSLIGPVANDFVGERIHPLTNGNYVVESTRWDNGAAIEAGAATFRSGTVPTTGFVTSTNSLIGGRANDNVGRVVALANGNYVAVTPSWDASATVTDVGATTWAIGTAGLVGPVVAASSFVGTSAEDGVGIAVRPLTNGNYVITAPFWNNVAVAVADVGAATWRPGNAEAPGTRSAANSLVGSKEGDGYSQSAVALKNGNYVVSSPGWDNGTAVDAGAATWGNGVIGTSGPVATSNSLVGTQTSEAIGAGIGMSVAAQVVALENGNYAVGSPRHDFGSNPDAGAVTWRPGDSPAPATVTNDNSLTGTTTTNYVGAGAFYPLPNGDFVTHSPVWDSGAIVDVGAVTVVNGLGGTTGPITAANSLVGTLADDQIGASVHSFEDGRIAVVSPTWDNGTIEEAGAVTIAVQGDLIGPVTATNSIVGTVSSGALKGGSRVTVASEGLTARRSIVVGRPAQRLVSLITATDYLPLPPARLADTRPGFATVDGIGAGGGQRGAGSTLELVVAGRGGVAADAVAASLNVTAVDPAGSGFVTVYPCGETQPTASNLNYVAGSIVPNAVLAKIGTGGKVCLFTSNATDLVVDVGGYFPKSSTYRSTNPTRVLETRLGLPTADGLQQGVGKNSRGQVIEVQITGRSTIPADADSVALNVTVTEPDGPGFVTVFPCGITQPLASNLNYVSGSDVANLAVSKIGAGGKVCIFTSEATHLVADVNGYFPAITEYMSLAPARLLETRLGLATIDGQSAGIGIRNAGTVTAVKVTGRAAVPADAGSVVLNVTITEPTGPGFVTVYPCGIEPPLASNLNFVTGSTIPNAAIVKVGANGTVCLFNSQTAQLVVDVTGYFPN